METLIVAVGCIAFFFASAKFSDSVAHYEKTKNNVIEEEEEY